MSIETSIRKYLKNYQPADFTITETQLDFFLEEGVTTVKSRLQFNRQTNDNEAELKLDGVDLNIIDLQINNEFLADADFSYDGSQLTVYEVPHLFTFEATVQIDPAANTRLEGLYLSNGNYCTQCEAEGFRHITFYPDRPDVMSVFTTSIKANKAKYPVLLSNGNKTESGEDDKNHWIKWHDPFPKPCYLFALVAGDLACITGSYQTGTGKDVTLEFYTEHHNKDKCDHALKSLQKAMKWDEETFGLEYDLDLYMVVAVDDFNMGAMENKGLNVFNTQYILANQETATDANYQAIEAVIGHEYFHNWTGNRVTCRDWFQLSLKEGLTVFRDQQFSGDMMSRSIQRINDVRMLRTHQFREDAGPMAHPVRPQSYLEINNFYTLTVYEKGAEVVRMYHTLLGKDNFRKGMDLYFKRHDGNAVTTDDFRAAMQDASGADLSRFQRWYDQAGTPKVTIQRIYDSQEKVLKLWVKQDAGKTKGEANLPFHLPMKLALIDETGQQLALNAKGDTEMMISIFEADQMLEFRGIQKMPLLSAFREFSAPVILQSDLKTHELSQLMALDTDPFNQWDAGQQYATQVMLDLIHSDDLSVTDNLQGLITAFGQLLTNGLNNKPLLAEMMSLPGEGYLAEMCSPVDIHKIHQVRNFVRHKLADAYQQQILIIYHDCEDSSEYELSPEAVGRRSLKNICLSYLAVLEKTEHLELAERQYKSSNNMTDQLGSLSAIVNTSNSLKETLFADFYHQWSDTALVVDKWFRLLASSQAENALHDIIKLSEHEAFNLKNPNRARSLIGAFSQNTVVFHDPSGEGYLFLADMIIQLDSLNPQVAARLSSVFLHWKKLVPDLREMMKAQILRIQSKADLSNDVAELFASCMDE